MHHRSIFLAVCVISWMLSSLSCQQIEDDYAEIVDIGHGEFVAEYTWYVDNILSKIASIAKLPGSQQSDTILSPEFYLGKPGYKARLSLSPYRNNSKDGTPYMGESYLMLRILLLTLKLCLSLRMVQTPVTVKYYL